MRVLVEGIQQRMGLKISPLDFVVQLGFLAALRVRFVSSKAAKAVLETVFRSAEGRMLRSVTVSPSNREDQPVATIVAALLAGEVKAPRVTTRLVLGTAFLDRPNPVFTLEETYGPMIESLDDVLAVFTNLDELRVDLGCAEVHWAALKSPRLRRFTWVAPNIRPTELVGLADSELPGLEAFAIWTGAFHTRRRRRRQPREMNETPPILQSALSVAELAPILSMLARCPKLRELGICNYGDEVATLLVAIEALPFWPQLHTLDLSHCELEVEDGAVLVQLVRRSPNLKTLRVEATGLDAFTRERLAALPIVIEGTPRQPGENALGRFHHIHER